MIPWLQVVEAISEAGRPLSDDAGGTDRPVPGQRRDQPDAGRPAPAPWRLSGAATGAGALTVDEIDGLSIEYAAVALQRAHVQHRAGGAAERGDPRRQGSAAGQDRRSCSTSWTVLESAEVRIALAQINPTVGDLEGNAALVIERCERRGPAGRGRWSPFPELVISGYPPEDLLLKDHFLSDCREALRAGRGRATDGHRAPWSGVPTGATAERSTTPPPCSAEGRSPAIYRKIWLPNYAVFDEKRYFTPGDRTGVAGAAAGVSVGLNICEDIWEPCGPTEAAARWGDARGGHQPVHVAVPRGQGQRARGHARRRGPGTPARTSSTSTAWAARTSWCSTARASCSDPRGRWWPGRRQFEEAAAAGRPGSRSRPARVPARAGRPTSLAAGARVQLAAPTSPGRGRPARRQPAAPPAAGAAPSRGRLLRPRRLTVSDSLTVEAEVYARPLPGRATTTCARTASSRWSWA